MSGALEKRTQGKTFVNTHMGDLCIRSNKNDPDAEMRTTKYGDTIYEKRFGSITGTLVNIEKATQEFQENRKVTRWLITLYNQGHYVLQLPLRGAITSGFMFRLPNLDLSKPIKIQTYYFEKDDRSALTIAQFVDGKWVTVDKYWKKDDMKKMPPLKEITVDGEKKYDSTDQLAYLDRFIAKRVNPALTDPGDALVDTDMPGHDLYDDMPEPKSQEESEPPKTIEDVDDDDDDDLPF